MRTNQITPAQVARLAATIESGVPLQIAVAKLGLSFSQFKKMLSDCRRVVERLTQLGMDPQTEAEQRAVDVIDTIEGAVWRAAGVWYEKAEAAAEDKRDWGFFKWIMGKQLPEAFGDQKNAGQGQKDVLQVQYEAAAQMSTEELRRLVALDAEVVK
jgi:hypothetical protein